MPLVTEGGRRQSTRVVLSLILAAAALAHLPALSAGFVADDFFLLSKLAEAERTSWSGVFQSGFFGYYRPLAFLLHAADWRVWGPEPFGFHLTNLLLHLANVVLVFLLGRRFLPPAAATLAAALFGLHAPNHEAVYWVAARFDLLATCCTLASLLALRRAGGGALVGALLFGLALLSKESALSLLVMAPTWDVVIDRRSARQTLHRWWPLVIVVLVYAVARWLASDVAVTGGPQRLPKLVMLGGAFAAVLSYAWLRDRGRLVDAISPCRTALAAGSATALVLLILPATTGWMAEKAGFVAYAVYHALTPVVTQSPPAIYFSPETPAHAVPGTVLLLVLLAAAAAALPQLLRRQEVLWPAIFLLAALLPVSSMVGGLRYLYLASAGGAWLLAALLARAASRHAVATGLVTGTFLALSALQIFRIGSAWQWAGAMTREGVARIARMTEPCVGRDVLLLTLPAGIRNVYGNFYYETFEVLEDCSLGSLQGLLRIAREDVDVQVDRVERSRVTFRLRRYRGNAVASHDLRNFIVRIEPGAQRWIDTPAGRLSTRADGADQVFTIELAPAVADAGIFFYSAGLIHHVRR